MSASYIHNSTVQAYGNIYVRGSGVYNSQLKARDEIHVEGKHGIVRGGYLEASKKINAQEIGVRSGVRCELVIRDADGEVEAGHLNIGVTVVINGVHFKNQHDVQGARLWYDPEAHAVKMTRQE